MKGFLTDPKNPPNPSRVLVYTAFDRQRSEGEAPFFASIKGLLRAYVCAYKIRELSPGFDTRGSFGQTQNQLDFEREACEILETALEKVRLLAAKIGREP